jgi:hypothetical protein
MMALGKTGRGSLLRMCKKQKINVRSSCEGELVGIDDVLPLILWARYFIEEQGYIRWSRTSYIKTINRLSSWRIMEDGPVQREQNISNLDISLLRTRWIKEK